jgi:hypothetical protein
MSRPGRHELEMTERVIDEDSHFDPTAIGRQLGLPADAVRALQLRGILCRFELDAPTIRWRLYAAHLQRARTRGHRSTPAEGEPSWNAHGERCRP